MSAIINNVLLLIVIILLWFKKPQIIIHINNEFKNNNVDDVDKNNHKYEQKIEDVLLPDPTRILKNLPPASGFGKSKHEK